MNDWLLAKFDELRRELAAAGQTKPFCDELRALVSPDGSLSSYEAIDASSPEQWREALERMKARGAAQLALTAAGAQREPPPHSLRAGESESRGRVPALK